MSKRIAPLIAGWLVAWTGAAGAAAGLEIPLEIKERAGVARADNPVNAGFPLPPGAVKDVGSLALFRRDPLAAEEKDKDQPAPSAFVVRQQYPGDRSARWVTAHFLASVGANDRAVYVVKDAGAVRPPFAIAAQAGGDRVTVDTGVLKFTVSKSNFNVIDQAWFDPTGKGKYDQPLIESGAAKLKANFQAGKYKIAGKVATLDVIGDPIEPLAKAASLALEENTPGRAVVKVTGTFMNDITPTLDFVVRIYATAGSGAVRVSFTVVNAAGREWSDFFGINELGLDLPVKLGEGGLNYTLSNSAGEDAKGPIKADESATLLQPQSEDYTLGGVASGGGKAKSIATRRLGWADLAGEKAGVCVGVRNFWQMHPKGLAVSGDGVLSVRIVPRQDKPAAVPLGELSQALTRIDLFTGGARTHEFLIAAHAPGDNPAAIAMAIVDPLLAVAPTSWYCQRTRAAGLLWDANPENFKPEHRDLIAAFQKNIDQMAAEVAGWRGGAGQGIEEYGLLNFGSQVELGPPGAVVRNDALNTRWEGNANDFPRAALVNFWRTGDPLCWELAEAAAMHLADIEIAHANPADRALAGIERTCPNRGHFRQWWAAGGEPFGVSGLMDSAKCQSLFDLYHMTGDAWYLDTALLVANYATVRTGNSLRAIGNRAKTLFEAYEQTADKKFLDADADWLTQMLVPRTVTQVWDEPWMYGLAAEGLADLYRQSGDVKWAQTAVNCADSLIAKHWKNDLAGTGALAGFSVNAMGYAYEFTGAEDYLRRGLVMLKVASIENAGRTKAFAEEFRLSPYFLYYLTNDYKPGEAVVRKR